MSGEKLLLKLRGKLREVEPRIEKAIFSQIGRVEKSKEALEKTIEGYKYWVKRDSRKAVDEMFFRYENLPPFTKEYWFMHFDGVEPRMSRQMILSFIKFCSGAKGNERLDLKQKPGLACWLFDREKMIIEEKAENVRVEAGKISCPLFTFEGSFPNYRLKVVKKGKEICNLTLKMPDRGDAFEFNSDFLGPFGFELLNLYLDFEGKLNGRPIKGKAYVQKIISTAPFLPWRWGYLHFKDGTLLQYFTTKLKQFGISDPKLQFLQLTLPDGKSHRWNDYSIDKKGGKWIISTEDEKLFVLADTYAVSKFTFTSIGTFKYDEYFTSVKDFEFVDGKRKITMDRVEHGSGLVEDASGFTY